MYVNYRTPLIALKTSGASSMKSTNVILSDQSSTLNLVHSGSGVILLELYHGANLLTDITGSSQVILLGRVEGDGLVRVSGAARLFGIKCSIRTVEVEVKESGGAFVYGSEGVYARVSGSGTIHYLGTLLSQQKSGAGSIRPYSIDRNPDEL